MIVGVISDTHGKVRPEALDALAGSDVILHAGDVGGPHVLEALQAIAPVHAIRGNVDLPSALRSRKRASFDPDWAAGLPDTLDLELGGARVHLVHALADLAPATRANVIVSGHSHQPSVERRDGILWLNPGSAGPRRFSLPVTVALLRGAGGDFEAELVHLG